MDWRSGDNPPCMHKILSSMRAATGRQLKQSMKVFQSLMLYRLLPEIIVKFTFVIKSVNSIDWRAFVIASQKKKVPWILNFISQKKANSFKWVFSSIDIITQKEVVALRREFAVIKQSQKVWVLAMNIALFSKMDYHKS